MSDEKGKDPVSLVGQVLGWLRDTSGQLPTPETMAEAGPITTPHAPTPAPSGLQPSEEGSTGLSKSYVGQVQGWLNDLSGRVRDLHAEISGAVDPQQQVVPMPPPGLQPNETVGNSDGSMVTDSPSGSGTGEMVISPVAGTKS